MYGIENKFLLRETAHEIVSGQDDTLISTLVANQGAGFGSSFSLKIIWLLTKHVKSKNRIQIIGTPQESNNISAF